MLVGYHGTTAKNAESILESGRFRHSSGNRHWLGDGVYFFAEEIHAYVWNRDHCKSALKDISAAMLLERYAILKATLKDNRVFDLDTVECKLLFEEAYTRACNKLRKAPEVRCGEYAEGVVLNLMFTHMDFDRDYDVVAATFRIKGNRYDSSPFQMRLPGIPQRQICVKNTGAICTVEFDNISRRAKDLEAQALTLQSLPSWGYNAKPKTRYSV